VLKYKKIQGAGCMEEKKKYILLEVNEIDEKKVKELLKKENIKEAPKNKKGIFMLARAEFHFKTIEDQSKMENFMYGLLLQMGEVLEKELKVTVIARVHNEDEDQYEEIEITIDDAEIQKKIENHYEDGDLINLFTDRNLSLYAENFEHMDYFMKQEHGYDNSLKLVKDVFKIGKYEANKIF
jgi:hypothetical protein